MNTSTETRLLVCGAGALGGNLVEHLVRNSFPGAISVVDHDRVEAENLGNQPYDSRHVGTSKVHALASRCWEIASREIEAVHATIDVRTAPRLLSRATLVVDVLDGVTSRLAVRDACSQLGIPVLHAALGPDGYAEVRGNGGYRLEAPADAPGPCRLGTTRAQVLLGVALVAAAIDAFLTGEEPRIRAAVLGEVVSALSR